MDVVERIDEKKNLFIILFINLFLAVHTGIEPVTSCLTGKRQTGWLMYHMFALLSSGSNINAPLCILGIPSGIRTRVFWLKAKYPRPARRWERFTVPLVPALSKFG